MTTHETMQQHFQIALYHDPHHSYLWNVRFLPKRRLAAFSDHENGNPTPRTALVIVDTRDTPPAVVFVPGDGDEPVLTAADYQAEALWLIQQHK